MIIRQAGIYVTPHHSTHRVSSKAGCLIFVKLMQMTEHEIEPTRINTNDPANWKLTEHRIIDQIFVEKSEQGIELFIIKGQLFCGTEIYPAGSWVRLPLNSAAKFQAGPSGATLYVKTGHLQHAIDVWVK